MMLSACVFLAVASIGVVLRTLRVPSMSGVLAAPRLHLWSVMHVWARENHRLQYAVDARLGWWHHLLVVVKPRSPFKVPA
jgi:hypothetical protein